MDSPFSGDFGDVQTGMHFQGGAFEQELCLTDLLDEICKKNECSGEESNSQKKAAIASTTLATSQVHLSPYTSYGGSNTKYGGSNSGTDTDMAQKQVQ